MIVVSELRKDFRSVRALDGVSFSVGDGEIVGLVGPNGAGKTTLIRLLAGVLAPDFGTAMIDGYDVGQRRLAAQRRIGVLPELRGLYPRLTAREHLTYFGRLHGLTGPRLERRIDDLAAVLGMNDIIDRRAKGFSRGQSLKVALGRALIHDPPNIVLDEPTNGLDIASSRAVRELMHRLRAEGRAIVFCSHIMAEVSSMCDRLVVLARGRVAGQGSLDALCRLTGGTEIEDVFLRLTREA